MRTKGKDTIITYGLGTSQIGFSGGNMVRLDNNAKQQLFQILGIKNEYFGKIKRYHHFHYFDIYFNIFLTNAYIWKYNI